MLTLPGLLSFGENPVRYFRLRLTEALKLEGAVWRLDTDGQVSWACKDRGWFPASPDCRFRTAGEIECAVACGLLVAV